MGTSAIRRGAGPVPRRVGRVVFVHGFLATGAVLHPLRDRVRAVGFGTHELSYGPQVPFVGIAERLRTLVDTDVPRDEPVVLVGHSLGGLVSRWYLQKLSGRDRVCGLVTLATPHGGVAQARLLPTSVGHALRPGGVYLRALEAQSSVPHVNIFGEADHIVPVQSGAAVVGAESVGLPCDHNELLYDPDAHAEVLAAIERFLRP